MLVIRLTRKGRKNQPFFRVVVTEKKRSAKGGRAVEVVGHIDPLTKKRALKKDRILHWIKMGAQPSDTVHNLLVSEKIIEGKKINVVRVKKSAEAAAPAATVKEAVPTSAPEAPKAESTPAPASAQAPTDAEAMKGTPADKPAVIPVPEPEKPSSSAKASEDKTENPLAVVVEKSAEVRLVEPKVEEKPEPQKA